jgi:peptidoglycan/xylan/chitin deacetylase (PgdA/CDA1 family)
MSASRLLRGVRRLGRRVRSGPHRSGLVLLYHRIADDAPDPWNLCVTPVHFEQHLEVLRRVGHPVSLTRLTDGAGTRRLPSRPTVVTFDDGYADNLQRARPLLARHDVAATVFVSTGYTGGSREFWWDELERVLLCPGRLPPRLQLEVGGDARTWNIAEDALYDDASATRDRDWRWRDAPPTRRHGVFLELYRILQPLSHAERRRRLDELLAWAPTTRPARESRRQLTADEVRALAAGGLVEVGAHTVTHPRLSVTPVDVQRDEIGRSKHDLEEIVGRRVTSFAYPFGGRELYSADSVALVKEAGFARACSTSPGVVQRGSDVFQLPRLVVSDCDGAAFEARLHAAFSES